MDEDIHKFHKMDLPHKVIVGENILTNIMEILDNLNISYERTIILTGPNINEKILKRNYNKNPITKRPTYIIYEATWKEVSRLEKEIKNIDDFDFLIAIGGGKTIDVTKLLAYKIKKEFISIPTSPSHDGISSPFASLRGGKHAYSYKVNPPYAVIVDMNVVANAPHKLVASGVGDAIAKFTAVEDWKLARDEIGEYYGEYAANLALLGAKLVSQYSRGIGKGDKESIRNLVEALISDGVAAGIAGSSRPCSGSEHLFSHALDVYASRHALHGEQVGVGTILMSYLHGLNWKEIREILQNAGAPTNYKELEIPPEDIINAFILAKSIRPDRYTILHKTRITKTYAREIAEKTKVIW